MWLKEVLMHAPMSCIALANNVIACLNFSKNAIAIWSSALVWLCLLSALCALRAYLLPGMCDRHQH